MDTLTLNFDGATEPNPGLGSWGWVLDGMPGHGLIRQRGVLPGTVTNNVSEYVAIGKGLAFLAEYAHELAGFRLVVRGDSQLVLKQVQGVWQCNHAHLAKLRDRVREIVAGMEGAGLEVVFEWVPREQNGAADAESVAAWEAAAGRTFPVRERRKRSRAG